MITNYSFTHVDGLQVKFFRALDFEPDLPSSLELSDPRFYDSVCSVRRGSYVSGESGAKVNVLLLVRVLPESIDELFIMSKDNALANYTDDQVDDLIQACCDISKMHSPIVPEYTPLRRDDFDEDDPLVNLLFGFDDTDKE